MDDKDAVALPNEPAAPPMQYRREIKIENVILHRSDIMKLMYTVHRKTEDARALQIASENPTLFDSEEHLKEIVRDVFRVTYDIQDFGRNSWAGHYEINIKSESFPDNIKSLHVSNTQAFKTATGGRVPRNAVDIYIDFRRPSMALNFFNLPSNPTENNSVMSVYGFDEDWVISTHQSLKEFFDNRKERRGFIHRSGVYDLFLWLVYLPILLWIAFRIETNFPDLLAVSSNISVVAIYIYGLVLSLMFGRVMFQYMRWLLPIVEYDAERGRGPKIHRGVIGAILLGLMIAFIYDFIRTVFF